MAAFSLGGSHATRLFFGFPLVQQRERRQLIPLTLEGLNAFRRRLLERANIPIPQTGLIRRTYISKLWQDTLKMRALMKKRKEQGVNDLEAGVSQSWKNAQARRDRAFDKRFNDEWNRYRSAGWKR